MMNSLYNASQAWVGDGSTGGELIVDENNLSIASASAGTPFNVRLDCSDELAAADYYFQVQIKEMKGNFSIGVVTKAEFHPGWKTKGMFYNGNLTNGSGALKISWGPRFQAGDSLGLRFSTKESGVEIAFFKNGASLGVGFRLVNNKNVYYPCLHVGGQIKLSTEFPSELPSAEYSHPSMTSSGFYGDWQLIEAFDGQSPIPFPTSKLIKAMLSKESHGTLQLGFKVGNSLNARTKIIHESDAELSIEHGPFMMTKMMPPPELRPLESLLSQKKMTTIKMEQDGTTLLISGPEMKTKWRRFVRVPEALGSY